MFEFDDHYRRLPGYVEAIETKRFDELRDEGGQVADDLKTVLRTHYPQIRNDDAVDVVLFGVEAPPQ